MKNDINVPEYAAEFEVSNPLLDNVAQKIQVLTFKIHDERFGVEIKYIQRVENLGKITPVPRTPDFVEGIINLRGTIVTLIEFSRFVSRSKKTLIHPSHVIVLSNKSMNLGLIVEMIYDVIYIPIDALQENEHLPENIENAYIKSIIRLQDKVFNIVNIEKIFKDITDSDFSLYEMGAELN